MRRVVHAGGRSGAGKEVCHGQGSPAADGLDADNAIRSVLRSPMHDHLFRV